MQIYVLAASQSRVQSQLLFKRLNRVTYGRDHNPDFNAEITMPITTPNTMMITIRNIIPYLFQRYITENSIPNKIPTLTQRSWTTQLQWQLTTANRCSLWSYMRFVASRATTIKKGGWLYQNLKQPLPQTIPVPEVQERSSVRHIQLLRRLAAANGPGHESTSGLRERR